MTPASPATAEYAVRPAALVATDWRGAISSEHKFRPTIFGLTAAARALHAPTAPQPAQVPFDLDAVLEWCGVEPDQVE
jgi:hypothetical protein